MITAGLGGLVPSTAAAAAAPPSYWWVPLIVAVIGTLGTAGVVERWHRRKTGEGQAAAADDMSAAATRVVAAGETLNLPLRRRIVELTEELARITERHAAARIEVHESMSDQAALKAQVAALEYELEALRIRLGDIPGRREGDA